MPTYTSSATSVSQFCIDHDITPPTYYKLKKQGLGPTEMRIGNIVRISQEAAAEWRRAREHPTEEKEVHARARSEAALRVRGQQAAKKAIKSPLHVSNRGAR